MDKNFMIDKQFGWNWHKSWILPFININIEFNDFQSNNQFNVSENLYVQLYAVVVQNENINNFHLLDVGLKGKTKQFLEAGSTSLTGIKFNSTSYNNFGKKIHLVIQLCAQNQNDNYLKIIDCQISPPIFVDSRKFAREEQTLKQDIKYISLYEVFEPENFEKQLFIRKKCQKQKVDKNIQNDLEGIINYLTAPNIRNKIKNPLFLAYKFSKCIQLYFKLNYFQSYNESIILHKILDLFQKIQKNYQFGRKINKEQRELENIQRQKEQKPLILYINCQENLNIQKKILNSVNELIQDQCIDIVFDNKLLLSNNNYIPLLDINLIKNEYELWFNQNNSQMRQEKNIKQNQLTQCKNQQYLTNLSDVNNKKKKNQMFNKNYSELQNVYDTQNKSQPFLLQQQLINQVLLQKNNLFFNQQNLMNQYNVGI
ncbi:zinc finger transcription factor sma, putative [Ichthyophthirius multifiliis]|uniref:Zinc finger transcription factor sma, putative n=1 Tax=Ichthyophthirius multifiliis TaxID=5932 RepID=G0QTD6_ICHMU|nr:zinc finger transcription factor sma, putative [Ichthyophthirius multifiliis]EGR31513.1 zinc finger transcription factor sma, putative [Ichthyophthirius multifiliis]|eukprot:XP_004034999.1 zinc finger transcription factor sma, putative [Ichthyophthirius multifiliis]